MKVSNLFTIVNKPTVIVVVGLPGSGKSTLIKYLAANPFKQYKVYDSWSKCLINNLPPEDFSSECRWNELTQDITQNKNVIISGFRLSDNVYLNSCLTALSNYEAEVEVLYLENNPEKCINNIKVRDSRNGGRFEGSTYIGQIFMGKPDFVEKIKNVKIFSKKYIYPKNASIIEVKKVIENINLKYHNYK